MYEANGDRLQCLRLIADGLDHGRVPMHESRERWTPWSWSVKKVGLYLLVVLLAVLGLSSALRAVEVFTFGFGAGRLMGSVLMAIVCLWGAARVFARAR